MHFKQVNSLANRLIFDISFHAYSIWLFTRSDLKTIVVPQSIFGIINALAHSFSKHGFTYQEVVLRVPVVFLWVWINLLPFAIDNQRQPDAILEDRANKPWRTMPSHRMTATWAKWIMLCLYPVALIVSLRHGGTRQCLGLMLLGLLYNDLHLADISWVIRNLINALGFCCFASGALEVAMKSPLSAAEHRDTTIWLCIIAAVVFSTVQAQDMADQPGDRLRGRRTMPLSVGDGTARWLTAAPMVAWSVMCPAYWMVGFGARALIGVAGTLVAGRMLTLRTVEADGCTFRLWNAWLACMYLLPLVAAVGL